MHQAFNTPLSDVATLYLILSYVKPLTYQKVMLTIKIKSFAQYNMEFTQLWRKGNSNLTKMLKPASIKAFSHLVLTKMSFLLN